MVLAVIDLGSLTETAPSSPPLAEVAILGFDVG